MRKLKILIVTPGVLNGVLGKAKVHHEMKQEWEQQGHIVDTLDSYKLYPKGKTFFSKFFGPPVTYLIWKHLKKMAKGYDVIDANMEAIIYPKASYGFKGIVMARSHGIMPVFKAGEQMEGYKRGEAEEKKTLSLKTRIGNFYRSFKKSPEEKDFYSSVQYADMVHCLNKDEYNYFESIGVSKEKLVIIPNALPEATIAFYNKTPVDNKQNALAFIGSWTIRKGVKDLEGIVNTIKKHTQIDKLYLLGGYWSEEKTRSDFSESNQAILEVIPHFTPEQIPKIHETVKVGLFPSYAEGFGYAVVEQLACGVPVVAYKVPGPSDILASLEGGTLLIAPGDRILFGQKVASILQMEEQAFKSLAERSKQESRKFLLSDIARLFIETFERYLAQ